MTTREKLVEFCNKMISTFDQRLEEHGESWKTRTGIIGLYCQAERKISRLHESIFKAWAAGKPINTAVSKDSALDGANYLAFMWIMLDEMEKEKEKNEIFPNSMESNKISPAGMNIKLY